MPGGDDIRAKPHPLPEAVEDHVGVEDEAPEPGFDGPACPGVVKPPVGHALLRRQERCFVQGNRRAKGIVQIEEIPRPRPDGMQPTDQNAKLRMARKFAPGGGLEFDLEASEKSRHPAGGQPPQVKFG